MMKPGTFISDRYEIIDNVGSGGMADVYKAKDQRLNRFVAIKVLKPEYSSDKSFVNKFRGEAQSAAGLSHPNIVNVYDVGDDSGLHYIVMELVEGITLKRFIERKGKLEIKEAVGIAIQIAQGMEAAHDNHIIHRDIKPQNIIISKDGKVKVTDFGIAKATNSNTITSNAMGSVHYLSPEQARGGYSDEKSDIYSLGVTIYEMLSGKVPFAGDNTVSVALLHIQGEAMPLRELDQNIPVSVDKIVQKCMQKRPERRYHSASELIADLKRAITNPDGDFVQIPAFVASDSPTINISDDLNRIKNGTYDNMMEVKNSNNHISDDDDELDSVDSKFDKFFTVGTIISIIVLAVVIIGIVVWFFFIRGAGDEGEGKTNPIVTEAPTETPTLTPTPQPSPTTGTYKFPYVLNYTKEDAEEIIKMKDPDAFITWKEDFSDEYDVGYVMEQYPAADRDAAYGSNVIIKLSTGPKPFTIPYVYYLTEEQAERQLQDYGLIPKRDFAFSDIEAGKVIETIPPKDTLVVSGTEVKIIVSKGPETVTIPSLLGKTEEQAKAMLAELGLVLGTVSHESSEIYAEGQITYQTETANQKAKRGDVIDVIISTGPADTTTVNPNPDPNPDTPANVSYIGKLTIKENILDTMGSGGEGDFIFEMAQGEWQSTLFEDSIVLDSSDFPFVIENIKGENDTPGIVTCYVDGEPYLKADGTPYTWTVFFEAVEE